MTESENELNRLIAQRLDTGFEDNRGIKGRPAALQIPEFAGYSQITGRSGSRSARLLEEENLIFLRQVLRG